MKNHFTIKRHKSIIAAVVTVFLTFTFTGTGCSFSAKKERPIKIHKWPSKLQEDKRVYYLGDLKTSINSIRIATDKSGLKMPDVMDMSGTRQTQPTKIWIAVNLTLENTSKNKSVDLWDLEDSLPRKITDSENNEFVTSGGEPDNLSAEKAEKINEPYLWHIIRARWSDLDGNEADEYDFEDHKIAAYLYPGEKISGNYWFGVYKKSKSLELSQNLEFRAKTWPLK